MKDNTSAFSAQTYDRDIRRTLPYCDDLYAQAMDLVCAFGKSHIHWLDVGCGTGEAAAHALDSCDVERMTLCDLSAEMLAKAAERLFSRPVQLDFWNIPVQALHEMERFDVITAIQVNHYLQREERAVALRNCYKALKSGGVFITFENTAPCSETGKALALKRWQSYQIRQGKSPEESRAHIARYGAAYFPIPVSEHLETMRRCGFQTVELFWLSYLQAGFYGIK